ncbi:response regulator transcription factor [Leptospira sp. 96542]|nr:response regulator transcription factor [Leptospira sp. 96542]
MDDHPVIRTGLQAEIEGDVELEFKGSSESILRALHDPKLSQSQILITDISLKDENGIQELSNIKKQIPHLRIIFFTMHRDWAYLEKAFSLGADGYILKSTPMPQLVLAIKEVIKGNKIFPDEIKNFKPEKTFNPNLNYNLEQLTKREREILKYLAEGKLNREIAEILNLSVRTIESHRASIFNKLNVDNIVELGQILFQMKVNEQT